MMNENEVPKECSACGCEVSGSSFSVLPSHQSAIISEISCRHSLQYHEGPFTEGVDVQETNKSKSRRTILLNSSRCIVQFRKFATLSI